MGSGDVMQIENRPFATRARTVDHLGREQIADLPTAISELWKNAYDAYATNVQMVVFDQKPLTVGVMDNGCGMTLDDILSKWLVVGTESKIFEKEEDRQPLFGLPYRHKQGQKGIGRLSAAHIGSVMLLISKSHKEDGLVVLLIDWRVFENPYLLLSDVMTPVVKVESLDEVFNSLPILLEALENNIRPENSGVKDPSVQARNDRIKAAWKLYDEAFDNEGITENGKEGGERSDALLETLQAVSFSGDMVRNWEVASGGCNHGTVLLISDVGDSLDCLLPGGSVEDREVIQRTLVGFVDPFTSENVTPNINKCFDYSIQIEKKSDPAVLITSKEALLRDITDQFEHILEGQVDQSGNFTGHVKSFGIWRNEGKEIYIPAPPDYRNHGHKKNQLGSFQIYIATFEQILSNTTHSKDDFHHFDSPKIGLYSGLRIYRDGLRVMPFGRPDNDFFGIEERRSQHAGREYWNDRRMFGRISISNLGNPNLKDKAGREGFIVNNASRSLKELVINILKTSARQYFGTNSDIRLSELPEIQKQNKENAARQASRDAAKKNRQNFRKNLRNQNAVLPGRIAELRSKISDFTFDENEDITDAQIALEEGQQILTEARVPGRPRDLKSLKNDYELYRAHIADLEGMVGEFSSKLNHWIDRFDPPEPWELLKKQMERQAGKLQARVNKWAKTILGLQTEESGRVGSVISERQKKMHEEGGKLVAAVREERLGLAEASRAMTEIWETIDRENEDIFESYIFVMESLKESIDLQALAIVGEEQNAELRSEVDRLNSLAQLGIAVEILGHELTSYEHMISRGLDNLPREIRDSERAGKQIAMGYHGLTQQLQFLTPLQLSGEKIQRTITGEEIYAYLCRFFSGLFERFEIRFEADQAFRDFSVYGQPARLFPVFINLVNNAQYWVSRFPNENKEERIILLSARDGLIVVSDTGPGVSEDDIPHLFSLFFTRKKFGGRGIGLYLARANLAAGLHEIHYVTDSKVKVLSGANFAVEFKNANFQS